MRKVLKLPFGVSYETFRNPGPVVSIDFHGSPSEQVPPHTGTEHWWGGATSQNEAILDVDSAGTAGGAEVNFWTWYFIEEGFDYGFVEAQVNGDWVTVPVTDDQGNEVSTDDDPFGKAPVPCRGLHAATIQWLPRWVWSTRSRARSRSSVRDRRARSEWRST